MALVFESCSELGPDEIGSSSGVRCRTHSPEIEYSEEDEENPEEDHEEDPKEDPEEDPEEDPKEENPEEELEEEEFEEEELLDESDIEEYRSEHFWSRVRRYHDLIEDAKIANGSRWTVSGRAIPFDISILDVSFILITLAHPLESGPTPTLCTEAEETPVEELGADIQA
ncbi:uncharacterized protein LOC126672581 [Mercurialis annua]|uniref:uncharacterized protein LOC126672581 n=1 Tax=Mercurialis annua TaxID=3986 RepID=UPI00215EED4B|nr:uncharacterized protein LOC126672581 [Mercurialis annua]